MNLAAQTSGESVLNGFLLKLYLSICGATGSKEVVLYAAK